MLYSYPLRVLFSLLHCTPALNKIRNNFNSAYRSYWIFRDKRDELTINSNMIKGYSNNFQTLNN